MRTRTDTFLTRVLRKQGGVFDIKCERIMENYVKKVEFLTSAVKKEGVPTGLPQIAVAGKSNVGKSSFINFLAGGGKPARVSKTP